MMKMELRSTNPLNEFTRRNRVGSFKGFFVMEEIWKDIPEYEGLYQASNLGRIKSLIKKGVTKERILIPNIPLRPIPYYSVGLTKNKVKSTLSVHRLVLSAFNGCSILHVNHINKNTFDNRLDNLEYVSKRENTNHMYNGRGKYMTGVLKRHSHIEKYTSMISVDGSKIHLGTFNSELEAHQAYLNKAKELGETKYVTKM